MKKATYIFVTCLFISLSSRAGVFTSVVSGNYGSSGTWTFTGADADGIPDSDDDVTIAGPHTITLTAASNAKTLVINPTGTINLNNTQMSVWGSFTNNGSSTGLGSWIFRGFGTYSGNPINNTGAIFFFSSYIIAPGVNLFKNGSITVSSFSIVSNRGSVNLFANGQMNINANGKWINAAGSNLTLSFNPVITGILDASANANTVTYSTAGYNQVQAINCTYYNLNINSSVVATKSLTAAINILNNLTIAPLVTLNCANNNINLGGNWNNAANTNCMNLASVNFTGSGIQTITRTATEQFKDVNLMGTGSVKLMTDVNISGTSTLTSGTLDPNTFVYHQKGVSWLGNGGACNTASAGIVMFDGLQNQTLGGTVGTTFGNLTINNPGFTVTCITTQTGSATTILKAGTFDPGTVVFHQKGALWNANGGTLSNISSGSITFDGTVPQSIGGTVGTSFGNIIINSTSTVSLARILDVAQTLTLQSGTLDVSASFFDINLSGNFVNNGGTLNAQSGTVYFTDIALAAQTVSGTGSTNFFNITSNNVTGGVTVTSSIMRISGVLQINTMNFGTSGTGKINLIAPNATSTGKIGPVPAASSLTGTGWSVFSYINGPATAYWQYLGTPISNTTLADWDTDTRFYMSGVGGNDGNACCPIFYSVRTYSPTTNTYTNVTTTTTSLIKGRGYMVWMADNLQSLTGPLQFDTKGTPNFGTVNRAVTAGGPGAGYNLVSNPYACPITYANVVAASSASLNANFLILQENGSYVTNPNSGTIAAAQGFMCIAGANGNITFTESCKNVFGTPNIIRQAQPTDFIRIASGNGTNGLGGETEIKFTSDAHNGKDFNSDMPFLASPYDDATNIYTTDNDGQNLLLNALDANQDVLEIPMSVLSGTPGSQLLSFKGINGLSAYSCATLIDVTSGEKTDLRAHDTYSFNANGAGEKHDFILRFERDGNCPLNEQGIAASLDASTRVFTNNGNILVQFGFEDLTDVVVTVLNVAGQEVSIPKGMTVSNETIALDSPGAHGIYLVKIAKGDEIVTKKIYY